MTPRRWKQIKEVFEAALAAEPDQRQALLEERCSGDQELKNQVEKLLASSEMADTFLETPAAEAETIFVDNKTEGFKNTTGGLARGAFVAGTILDNRYRIIGMIGKGGMGEVYKAEDIKLDQVVALKFLPDELEKNADALRRFVGEVRIARQVSHPNVCRVFDIGDIDGRHFISMEFIEGDDLSILLTRIGRLPSDKASEISRQICFGLHAIHDAGILHRDLKPANVIIDHKGKARITDFGIAGFDTDFKDQEIRVGTPAYMSPEQIAGKEVTVKSDIYSLGLLIYEIFTGKQAFNADSLEELLEKQRTTSPSNPSTHVENIEPIAEKTINRCLEKAPADRPDNAMKVALSLPGGNPLEAAIMAGETPSPEMVAAAPKKGVLKPAIAILLFAGVIASLFGFAYLNGKYKSYSLAPVSKSPGVLAEKARSIITDFGYKTSPVSTVYKFAGDRSYSEYEIARGFPDGSWDRMSKGQPAPVSFWYRESPRYLAPTAGSQVTETDPALDVSGMISIKLDPLGRLMEFTSVPKQTGTELTQTSPDWKVVFEKAGLNISKFEEAESEWIPPVYSTKRIAWKGTLADFEDIPIRVEAASLDGKPVYFEVVAPWDRADREEQIAANPFRKAAGIVMIVLYMIVVIGALFLAWRNLRIGRGDLKGGLKLAVFMAFCLFVAYLAKADHVPEVTGELVILYEIASYALFRAFFVFLLYISLEPFVRRWWSELLISWNRLLAGDFRDPMIGRDVLVGALGGCAHTLAIYSGSYLRDSIIGKSMMMSEDFNVGGLNGGAEAFGLFLEMLAAGTSTGFTLVFLLLITYVIFRNKRLSIFVVFFLVCGLTGLAFVLTQHWAFLFSALILGVLVIFTLARYGLLAMITFWLYFYATWLMTTTLDTSRFYFSTNFACLLVFVGIAGFAAYTAIGGRAYIKETSWDR